MRALQSLDAAIHRSLVAHSIQLLRIVVGLVFLLFGLLKFFPGVSPAEALTIKTTDALSFDLIPGHIAIVIIACLECIIGLLLISGRGLRIAIYLLAGQLIGILAPLALFTDRLFAGPHHAPTGRTTPPEPAEKAGRRPPSTRECPGPPPRKRSSHGGSRDGTSAIVPTTFVDPGSWHSEPRGCRAIVSRRPSSAPRASESARRAHRS